MATKKRLAQLEELLEWERKESHRMPPTCDLFNRRIGKDLYLREVGAREWCLEHYSMDKESGGIKALPLYMRHTTLIEVGLAILEAVKKSSDRFTNSEEHE